MAPVDASSEDGASSYLDGWSAISRSMEEGVSWSGHERNVAWLNAGDGTFVEASGPIGFDQLEDGRVVCKTDWDRDGDLDLWLRSRNGATLRYLENQSNPESFLEVSGLGARTRVSAEFTDSGSTDGKSGEVTIEPRLFAAAITDGYLAAPSRRLTVAVPDGLRVNAVAGAMSPFQVDSVQPVSRLRFVAGSLEDRNGSFEPRPALKGGGSLEKGALPTRTVLRSGLAFPASRLNELGVTHEREPKRAAARLLVVRSAECPTCESVLPDALAALGESGRFHEAESVEVVEFPVSIDLEPMDSERATTAAAVRSIVASVLGPGAELALPLSILFDATGTAQVIYQADLDAVTVSQDAKQFAHQPVQGALRTTWGAPGAGSRWFHGSPRSFASLRSSLESQGLQGDADFYAALAAGSR